MFDVVHMHQQLTQFTRVAVLVICNRLCLLSHSEGVVEDGDIVPFKIWEIRLAPCNWTSAELQA